MKVNLKLFSGIRPVMIKLLLIFMVLTVNSLVQATELNIAVASNFQVPAEKIQKLFEEQYQVKIQLLTASSGKHFAQIINGAPVDVFMAADVSYIEKLIEQGKAVAETNNTYAVGKLAMVFRKDFPIKTFREYQKLSEAGIFFTPEVFKKIQFRFLSMANPDLAPYGRAAQEVLGKMNFKASSVSRLVVGENINQAQQFLTSGNADLAMLALSQVINTDLNYLPVPTALYAPIRQNLVLIKSTRKKELALQFVQFLKTKKIRELIQKYGYDVL